MPSTSLRCPSCSRPLGLPLPILCPGCGSFTDRPPEVVAPEPGAVTLIQGTTDDDGNPYTVVGGKPIPRCPECEARLPADDTPTCDRCGWNRAAGRKLPKSFAPIHRTWEAGWSLRSRMITFAVFQALNIASAILVFAVDGRAVTTTGGFLTAVICQAFVLGTFDRLDLIRTTKGKVTLTQQGRIALWPLPPKMLKWREHEEIRVFHAETGWLELMMFFELLGSGLILVFLTLQPTLLIMAGFWWWYVIRPGQAKVALCKDLGDPVTTLYLGTNAERAEEIAKEVSAATGLPWRAHGA
jgi:hypothetical protein